MVAAAPRSWFGDATLLVFALAQLCDGALTYVGVLLFGLSVEANPIVAWYIAALGAGVGLIAVKALAFGCGATLHVLGRHRIVGALAALYGLAAVWPWTQLLQSTNP